MMSAAGAESVMAPIDTTSAPADANAASRSNGTCPDTMTRARPAPTAQDLLAAPAGDRAGEHDDRRAGVDGLAGLLDRRRFGVNRRVRPRRPRARHAGGEAAARPRVVGLDDDALVEGLARADAAADAHGILLQRPQERQRLARVGDAERARRRPRRTIA